MTRNAEFDVRGRDVPASFAGKRMRFSLGVPPGPEARRRRALLQEHLRERHEWAILNGIAEGALGVGQVVAMLRRSGLHALPELRLLLETARVGAVPTFEEEAEAYLAHYAGRREAWSVKNTRSRLKRVGEQLVSTDAGEVPLSGIRMDTIARGHVDEAVRKVSSNGSTQFNLLAAASGLFTWSIAEEAERARTQKRLPRWTVNPCAKVEKPKRTKRIVTASDAQVVALLDAAQLYQVAYLRAFVQVGLRAGELAHTRMHHDLDPETWLWRIQARGPDPRCICPQCRTTGWSPKSENGERTFRVPESQAELREALSAYLDVTRPEPGDFVFQRPHGGPWTVRTLGADFEELCIKAGVRYGAKANQGLTLHSLRHTCATNLVRRRERESVIAALLGDAVKTVVETYVHLDQDDLAEAIGRSPSFT